ncbi:hypothetical protein N7456_012957 [Penicillium angulare]|uniref:Secreted protein n=1 Tax=Penicillium angulare TaxID=116970 RepID=A0A9W9EKS8_9EURO|nr:hypothetical protein N7456_012957 [Penicillium angulare]
MASRSIVSCAMLLWRQLASQAMRSSRHVNGSALHQVKLTAQSRQELKSHPSQAILFNDAAVIGLQLSSSR